ncbi:MAG: hypothetical protein HY222_06650 [Thaumarchaeota archaeon]|nr:hypothetical protein [Nitrososphaerota archaeon]MBI3642054.1 hypothetical protein [Nitrososphaerota archaeon]
MKTRIITLSLVFMMLLLVISLPPFTPKSASAHISKVFGNYIVEVGWANEPAFAGQMNSIQVIVKKDNVDNGTAIVDALANMQISVKYGTVSKQLDFVPSDEVLGLYSSPLIPTRVGSYNVAMKGTVEGQNIDTEYVLDDVGSSDTINFPQTSDTSSNMGQIGTIINQLTSDIEDAKSSANSAAQSVANVGKSFQEVKDTTDKLYMISMAGIGIGVAGIVIAVFGISRKGEKI